MSNLFGYLASRKDRLRWLARLFAAWAIASLAWGLNLLDPAEGHTEEVIAYLPYLTITAIVATICGYLGLESPRRGRIRSVLPYVGPVLTALLASLVMLQTVGLHYWLIAFSGLILLFLLTIRVFSPFASGIHVLTALVLLASFLVVVPWHLAGWVDGVRSITGQTVVSMLKALGHDHVSFDGTTIYALGRYVFVDGVKTAFPYATLLAITNLFFMVIFTKKRRLLKALFILFGWWAMCSFFLLHYVLTEPAQVYAVAETSVRLCWTTPLVFGLLLQLVNFIFLWNEISEERVRLFLPRVVNSLSLARLGLASALLTAAVFFFYCYGVYQPRPLKIIVDEIHCRWEPFYGEYGREDADPTFSENNYRSFLRWLTRYWNVELVLHKEQELSNPLEAGVTVSKREKIGKWLLEGDVSSKAFVIKCVTKPYSDDEVAIIDSFVRQGGNLIVVGEHTDVLFMNTYLNKVSTKFGMFFPADSIYNLDGDWCVSTRLDMAHHPALHFVDDFYWANGCTIKLQDPAKPLIQSPWASFTEPANYYVENFFGNKIVDRTDDLGRSVIAATAEKGLGRVFAWTDSTCFNNHLFFTYGRRRLIKSVLGWFSSKGSGPSTALTLLLLLVSLLLLGKNNNMGSFLWSLFLVAPLALALGFSLASFVNARTMPAPSLIRPLPQKTIVDGTHRPRPVIVFEGRVRWEPGVVSLLPIFGDLARLPWFPEAHRRGPITKQTLKNCKLLVIAGNRERYSQEEIETIEGFVQQGGGLLLIEGASSDGAINSLAHSFGLEFATGRFSFPANASTLLNPTIVTGGEPLLTVEGKTVIAYSRVGAGLVLAFGDDQYFALEHERRGQLGLGQLFHDMAKALSLGNEGALRSLPLKETIVSGNLYQ